MGVSSPDNSSIIDFDAWALALTRAADFSGGLISLSSAGGACSVGKAKDKKMSLCFFFENSQKSLLENSQIKINHHTKNMKSMH